MSSRDSLCVQKPSLSCTPNLLPLSVMGLSSPPPFFPPFHTTEEPRDVPWEVEPLSPQQPRRKMWLCEG